MFHCVAAEVDEIYAWNETTMDDPMEVECTTNTAGIPHSMDTGHLDPDHKTSELHSGEVEETRDHLSPGTTPPGT